MPTASQVTQNAWKCAQAYRQAPPCACTYVRVLHRYAQAEAKFKEAIEEAKLGFDPKDPHIPSCINNLAELYRNLGQYDKAGELYKEVSYISHQQRSAALKLQTRTIRYSYMRYTRRVTQQGYK